jgi:hypothetical protein
VAIESNVRYVYQLLPTGATTRVLFTDGDPESKNVQYQDKNNSLLYRKPDLPRLDGPAEFTNVQQEVSGLTAGTKTGAPVLLYFTGHGSPVPESNFDNNVFDLWHPDELSVKSLASLLKGFSHDTPITLVMVECFSGAFGNLLFQNGDPKGDLADLNVCGFFASVPQRMAAGCTPEVNEAEYKDFTGYFFAALTGTDRVGRKITGVDYNHDGKIGMNEAYAYAIIHDDSIDTPVCTSDTFVRRFIKTPDADVFKTPFSQVRSWATPAQLVALDQLSDELKYTTEDRLQQAYDSFGTSDVDAEDFRSVHVIRFVRLCKSVVLAHQLETTADQAVKDRFKDLLRAEDANPLKS